MSRLFLLALVLACAPLAAQPVAVPGTRVALEPPTGFRAADQFDGFQNDSLSASLLVAELPGAPFAEVVAGFTVEAFASRGIAIDSLRELTLGGAPALFAVGTQRQGVVAVDKWILAVGDSLGVGIINGTAPLDSPVSLRRAMRGAVLSTVLTGSAPGLFDGLPFTIPLPDDLPDHNRVGPGVVFSDGFGGSQPDGAPLFIASLGSQPVADVFALARARFQEYLAFDGADLTTEPITIDGRDGLTLSAAGTDPQSGAPTVGRLVLVPGVPTASGYVLMLGLAGESFGDAWGERFREIAESVQWAE